MDYRDRRRGGYNPPMDDYSGRHSNVSPWQNGVPPGDQSNLLSNNILPNLSEQTKLLLANNIINTILNKPEQNQLSSLLNQNYGGMNNYGPRNDYMGNNQYSNNNLLMGNYSGNDDFHRNFRHEPYPKNRNRPSAGFNPMNEKRKFLSNRSDNSDKGRLHKSKPVLKPTPKVKLSKESSFKSKTEDRDNKACKRDDSEVVEKKRDWKDEKKSESEEREETKDEEKEKEVTEEKEEEDIDDKKEKETVDKDNQEKMETDSVKEEKQDTNNEEEANKEKASKELDQSIIKKYLICHICSKTMWDERSWNNHLNGKAHKSMMTELELTYRAKVDLMRHEMKVIEQKRQILHEKRTGQRFGVSQYCVMCELRFGGNIAAHRKSDRHQKLRKFLHPNCDFCKKEFRNRLEWEVHRLTLSHIRKYAEKMEKSPNRMKNKGKDIKKDDDEDADTKDDDVETSKQDDEKNNDETNGDEENSKLSIPQFKEDVSYGKEMVSSISASFCKCCDVIFKTNDLDRHCKTRRHYNSYIKQIKNDEKNLKKKHLDDLEELDDEGNWKRRKIIEEEYKKFEKHILSINSVDNSQDNSQDNSALDINESSILKSDSNIDESCKEDESQAEKKHDDTDWEDIKNLDDMIEEVEDKLNSKDENEEIEKEEEEEEEEEEVQEVPKEEENKEVKVTATTPKTRGSNNRARRGRKPN